MHAIESSRKLMVWVVAGGLVTAAAFFLPFQRNPQLLFKNIEHNFDV